MKMFQHPIIQAYTSPDIVIERVGECRYECYCDRALANNETPLEEQNVWLILKISITEFNGETRITQMYPMGSMQYGFSPKRRESYLYDYAK